ncbi:hypothetical protein BLNAU_6229 [Blattamonas nauphoetae]|uniref:Uncharacterized protein n=1 Tax=Blattamonas nauphoetae TaxID=2049346 RepID=A0ABQ9Y4R2_9EUKA|nr:hypothetical protein BLNAU_6229 [Blattamonas nauphoetae]
MQKTQIPEFEQAREEVNSTVSNLKGNDPAQVEVALQTLQVLTGLYPTSFFKQYNLVDSLLTILKDPKTEANIIHTLGSIDNIVTFDEDESEEFVTPEIITILLQSTLSENAVITTLAWSILMELSERSIRQPELFNECHTIHYVLNTLNKAHATRTILDGTHNRIYHVYENSQLISFTLRTYYHITAAAPDRQAFWVIWPVIFQFSTAHDMNVISSLFSVIRDVVSSNTQVNTALYTTGLPFAIVDNNFVDCSFCTIAVSLAHDISQHLDRLVQTIYVNGLIRRRRRIFERKNEFQQIKIITQEEHQSLTVSVTSIEEYLTCLKSILSFFAQVYVKDYDPASDLLSQSDLFSVLGSILEVTLSVMCDDYTDFEDEEKMLRTGTLPPDHPLTQANIIFSDYDDYSDLTKEDIDADMDFLMGTPKECDIFDCSFVKTNTFYEVAKEILFTFANVAASRNSQVFQLLVNTYIKYVHPVGVFVGNIERCLESFSSDIVTEVVCMVHGFACSANVIKRMCIEHSVVEILFFSQWDQMFKRGNRFTMIFAEALFQFLNYNIRLKIFCHMRNETAENVVLKQLLSRRRIAAIHQFSLSFRGPAKTRTTELCDLVEKCLKESTLDRQTLQEISSGVDFGRRRYHFPPSAKDFDLTDADVTAEMMEFITECDDSERSDELDFSGDDISETI